MQSMQVVWLLLFKSFCCCMPESRALLLLLLFRLLLLLWCGVGHIGSSLTPALLAGAPAGGGTGPQQLNQQT